MLVGEWLGDRLRGEWVPTAATVADVAMLSSPIVVLGKLHIGSRVKRRVHALDEDGFPTAATVTGTVTLPAGTVVNLTVATESPGVYLVTFPTFTVSGWHRYRIASTGGVVAVDAGRLHVNP